MTHARTPGPTPAPSALPRRVQLDGIADLDDLLRQLADLCTTAPFCRRKACRRADRCQGGKGPPCMYQWRKLFAAVMQDGLRDVRRFWRRQRALQRPARESRAAAAPTHPASGERAAQS